MSIQPELMQELAPILANKGYCILDIIYKHSASNGSGVLQVTIAKQDDTPITIDDCSNATADIYYYIDANDKIKNAYTLEVTSKGCEDEMLFFGDYIKNSGKIINLELKREKDSSFIAQIVSAKNGKITLKRQSNINNIVIPVSSIKKAVLVHNKEGFFDEK